MKTFQLISFVILAAISALNVSAASVSSHPSGSSDTSRQGRSTVVTFFNDKSGASGINMYQYASANIRFEGRKVYPAAVHQNQASTFLYDVFEVQGNGMNSILVQIVDFCDKKDSSCTNVRKFNFNRLFDIHKSAWKALGKDDGVLKGNYRKVGRINPSELPKDVWSSKVQSGQDFMLCSCRNDCGKSDRVWKRLGQCHST